MKWYNPWTWAPFTHEGRQTLVYLVFAGAGPALTLFVLWIMQMIRDWTGASEAEKLERFAGLANYVGLALLIVVVALACFVSIRAFKASVGKDGLSIEANGEGDDNA